MRRRLPAIRPRSDVLERDGIRSPVRTSQTGQSYGGINFSRGALYAILKNPAYIGKISHKGKIHDGLHEGIIPPDIWAQVQTRLSEQRVARTTQTKERHMLQGLLYDPDGTIYSPTFTKKNGRQYRYYVSQNLLQYRDHPNGLIARLPSHEIETLVENAIRSETRRLCDEEYGPVLEHLLKHQEALPAYDLIRKCVNKITIDLEQLTIRLKPRKFSNLVEKYLNISVTECTEELEITVPYKTGRARRGAIIIKPEGPKDIFDLPPDKLKKLVQGIIWRDEHFAGMTLKDIAARENCSQAYVGTAIFQSFEILQSAA